jgi:hypothetical protein
MRKSLSTKSPLTSETAQAFLRQQASKILSTLIVLSSTFLLYQYREGGIKDAGLTDTSIRDVGGYVTTGKRIIDQVNPYIPDGELWGGARWGTFGTIPVALISELIPRFLQVVVFQTLGLLGLYLFLATIFRNIPRVHLNLIFLLLIWSSSYREMLATNQIIGMVLGLVALGINALFLYEGNKHHLIKFLGTLSFVIALDLKPHISGLMIVGLYLFLRRGLDFIWLVTLYVVTHAAVNVYLGRIVELDWIEKVGTLSDRANRNELGDSVTFWPVIRKYIDIEGSFGVVSKATLLLLVLLTFWLAYKKYWGSFFFLSFFAPAFSIYFHYYDAVPFVGLIFWAILSRQQSILSFAVLDLLIISKEATSLKNIVLVVCISSLVAIFSTSSNSTRFRNMAFSVIGFGIWQVIYHVNSRLNLNQYELQSLVVTEVLVLAALYFITSSKGSNKLQNFRNE